MASAGVSTQNTQYDKIGTKYNSMHDLPAVQPEEPSVRAVLGDIQGLRCLGSLLSIQVTFLWHSSFPMRMSHVMELFTLPSQFTNFSYMLSSNAS
jgi:hypothetical protein